MLKLKFIILLVYITHLCSAQDWSDPINISNLEGMDNQPDIAIDNNGNFHCVWAHKIANNYWKIYYSKSTDGGITWSSSLDISKNNEKWVSDPHIVCDTGNNLHVTYDYDVGNYMETMIYYKLFDGATWSEPINVSDNMKGSYRSKIAIDKNNRVYIFWYRAGIAGYCYYRYFENGNWSDIISPFDYHMVVVKIVNDSNNDLHCLAAHHGGQSNNNKYVYFKYDYTNSLWSDTTELTKITSTGADMDLDFNNSPHIAWCQMPPGTATANDTTMYRFYTGNEWSTPELVVEDPREQQIEIDENWKPNIFDTEKAEDGSMFVHHYNKSGVWEGYIIDESSWSSMSPVVENYNNKLFAVYVKPYLNNSNGDIFFSKSNIITSVNNSVKITLQMNLYPNPFHQNLHISFEISEVERVSVKIYTLQGKLVNTLQNEIMFPGNHEIIWNGNDKDEKKVSTGLYLVRLQVGRYVVTRSVILAQ